MESDGKKDPKKARAHVIAHPKTGAVHHVKAGPIGTWFKNVAAHAGESHVHNETCLEETIAAGQSVLDTDEEFPEPESAVFEPDEKGAKKPEAKKK